MLPMTVLRRFDCVLEPTKQAVLKRHARLKDGKVKNFDPILNDIAKDAKGNALGFHNHSELEKFDYLLANPPFGVDWKAEQDEISKWSDYHGYTGKLPRVNDGALMFLLTTIGKFQPVDPEQNKHGTRIAIVFNGSPLFTGGAGSGESEIRRWIIENDWLEAIIALPEQIACLDFLDAVRALEAEFGSEPNDDWSAAWPDIQRIAEEAKAEWTTPNKKLFRAAFTKVEPTAKPVIAKRGSFSGVVSAADFPRQKLPTHLTPAELDVIFGVYPATGSKKAKTVTYEANPDLRDFENIPLKEDIVSFFLRETRPFVPDAWIDRETRDEHDNGIGKVGYEINFNREFYSFEKPRSLDAINTELQKAEEKILHLLKEVIA